MIKQAGGFFAALLLILSLSGNAGAAEKTGSIQVSMKMQEGEVALFCVGSAADGGYLLEDSYGGGMIKPKDAFSPELAQWLSGNLAADGIYRSLSEDGIADFRGLSEGLYLLVQTRSQQGYYPMNPFLITLPYSGRWHVQANPKTVRMDQESPRTGQSPAPFLGMVGMVLSGLGLAACGFWKRRTVR